jgi:hypothetical protein
MSLMMFTSKEIYIAHSPTTRKDEYHLTITLHIPQPTHETVSSLASSENIPPWLMVSSLWEGKHPDDV